MSRQTVIGSGYAVDEVTVAHIARDQIEEVSKPFRVRFRERFSRCVEFAVRGLEGRYGRFVDVLRERGWYDGPVLRIDVSKVDFVSNVRHLIAVYEGVERCLAPGEQLGLFPQG